MDFYTGLHQPADAKHFYRCMVSVARLNQRRSDFTVNNWMLDSGAFTQVVKHGRFLMSEPAYAMAAMRWAFCGNLVAAVTQDYMCEPVATVATGLSVSEHQELTVSRYDKILSHIPTGPYLMPVIQGYTPREYERCIALYGSRLSVGMWVGVGSVCKRNARVSEVLEVLQAIKSVRPDLKLHGFGLKKTALASDPVKLLLHSADSMAWSFAARRNGGNANSWREAYRYAQEIIGPEASP